jgi:uncharacterized membrane protein YhaH (DUF805 family)
VSFGDAVRSVLTQYAVFSGRSRRSEYWYFTLFDLIILAVAFALGATGNEMLTYVALALYVVNVLGLLVPGIAVTVRRLHDTGRSGWWYLLSFVPFGAFVVLYFLLQDSQPMTNAYGPSPKHEPVVDGDFAAAPAV